MTPEEFDSHPVWASMNSTLEALNAVNIQNEPDASFAKRAIFIANYILQFRNDFSELYTQSGMDVVHNTWGNVTANVQNYINNTQLAFLQNAKAYAESCLDLVATWPAKSNTGSDPEKVTAGYRNLVDGLEKDQKRVRALITSLELELNALIQRESQGATDFRSNLDELGRKLVTFETSLQLMKADIEGTQKDFSKDFEQSQKVNENTFTAWLLEEQKVFEVKAQPYVDEIAKIFETAKGVLAKIDKTGEMTEKVSVVTTSEILSTNYEGTAKSDRKTALTLYAIGTCIFVLGFLIIVFAFGRLKTTTLDWPVVTLKLALVSILIAATSVPIRLGSRFMSQFTHFKRTELELRAITPFLADIQNLEYRDEIKKNFIEKTFANPIITRESDVSKEDGLKTLADQIVKGVIDKLPGKGI